MEQFIRFLITFKNYFVFLLCFAISLTLLFSNQTEQVLTIRAIFADVSGAVTSKLNWFSEVFYAMDELERLRTENVRLQYKIAQFREVQEQLQRLQNILNLKSRHVYDFKTGSIIHWTTPLFSFVTIDIGKKDGISKNDPVVIATGLVGKVYNAGENTAICQLLTEAHFVVSAVVRTQYGESVGFLQYKGDVFAKMEVNASAGVEKGDSVVTSGHSNIYPYGIPIGIVEEYAKEPGLFKTVFVRLFVNYGALREVSVITNALVDSGSTGQIKNNKINK